MRSAEWVKVNENDDAMYYAAHDSFIRTKDGFTMWGIIRYKEGYMAANGAIVGHELLLLHYKCDLGSSATILVTSYDYDGNICDVQGGFDEVKESKNTIEYYRDLCNQASKYREGEAFKWHPKH